LCPAGDTGCPALPLPEPGAYEVQVRWQLEPGEDFKYEHYDVRAGPPPVGGEPGRFPIRA
jgi:hypothetical protein